MSCVVCPCVSVLPSAQYPVNSMLPMCSAGRSPSSTIYRNVVSRHNVSVSQSPVRLFYCLISLCRLSLCFTYLRPVCCSFCVFAVFSPVCLFCVVSTSASDYLESSSLKLPVMCRARRKTLLTILVIVHVAVVYVSK